MERDGAIHWDAEGRIEVLTFDLGCATFAIEASLVREILEPQPETRVPRSPAQVPSIINFRGRIIPVTDLRPTFRQPVWKETEENRIVVIECRLFEPTNLLGIKTDRVHEVTAVERTETDAPPDIGMNGAAGLVRRLIHRGEDAIAMPDLERIFAPLCNGRGAAPPYAP